MGRGPRNVSRRRTSFIAAVLVIAAAALVPASARAATPTLTTQVDPQFADVNESILDTAFLAGGDNPTGTITFQTFTNATCTGTPGTTQTRQVAGNGIYETPTTVSVAIATTAYFLVSYSGDANNDPVSTTCGDPNETVVVADRFFTPEVQTTASLNTTVGQPITDSASVTTNIASPKPTGKVFFRLYGPGNATCTGDPIFASVQTLSANGTATSDAFAPAAPGTYRWTASYLGDSMYEAVPRECNQPNESVQVAEAVSTPTPPTVPTPSLKPAPDTFITSPPIGKTRKRDVTISFASNQLATFTCSLDDAAFTPCDSPQQLVDLARTTHTFHVRATNGEGTTDPTPVSETFTVARRRPHRR